jgi:hypothetical protein
MSAALAHDSTSLWADSYRKSTKGSGPGDRVHRRVSSAPSGHFRNVQGEMLMCRRAAARFRIGMRRTFSIGRHEILTTW